MEIVIGVITSLIAALIIYLSRSFIIDLAAWLFSQTYPNISGRYRLHALEQNADSEDEVIVDIKQIAHRISGKIIQYNRGVEKITDLIVGSVSPSRIVKFYYESPDRSHHSHGAALLRILPNGKNLKGHMVFICDCCEESGEEKIVLERV